MYGRFVALLFMGMALSGCISDEDPDVDSGPAVMNEGESAEEYQDPQLAEKPEKRWEPTWTFHVLPGLQVDPGTTVELYWDVSDLDDYEYPQDFLDYTLTVEGIPDPIAEGSALDLPGTANITLHKEQINNLTLSWDDGQGVQKDITRALQIGLLEGPAGPPEVIETFVAYWTTMHQTCESDAYSGSVNSVNTQWLDINPATQGQDYQVQFSGGVQGVTDFRIRWSGADGLIQVDSSLEGGDSFAMTGVVPEGATRAYFDSCYGTPGSSRAHYFTGSEPGGVEFADDPQCRTDFSARYAGALGSGVNIGTGLYAAGTVWIYAETNGVAGLQRNDSSWAGDCQNPDMLIF